jgi:hypothetical protein
LVKNATCTEEGYNYCACGAINETTRNLAKHVYDLVKNATCTEEGYNYCICGEVDNSSIIASSHNWVSAVPADCKSEGFTQCSACAEVKDIVPVLPHSPKIENCTICAVCGVHDLGENCSSSVPCNFHQPHTCTWIAATCTAPKTCSYCFDTEGEALGHSYFTVSEPTCTESGRHECRRTGCNEFEILNAIGHDWVELFATATCIDDMSDECSNCGEIRVTADKLGHNWGTDPLCGTECNRAGCEVKFACRLITCMDCNREAFGGEDLLIENEVNIATNMTGEIVAGITKTGISSITITKSGSSIPITLTTTEDFAKLTTTVDSLEPVSSGSSVVTNGGDGKATSNTANSIFAALAQKLGYGE